MKRWCMALAVSFALGGACAHTKTTDDGTDKKQKTAEEKQEKQRTAETRKSTPDLHPGDRDAVPVATAPGALLKPGAEDKIREQLVAAGFLARDGKASDASMREGLRDFQRAKDLPATGMPDHETVKRLGLDPDEIFRQATVKD
jgi:putative peptidoglycan binding protein